MGYLGDLVTDLGERIKDFDVTTEPSKSRAIRAINQAYRWIYTGHPWEWRFKTGQITLIPNYTTGTCSVTQFDGTNEGLSRTVTFSGAILTSAMVGRYFKVSGSSDWHKILYINGSTAILETPVIDVGGSGKNFEIWKRLYHLPGEVAQITDFGRWDNRFGRLEYKSFSNLADQVANVSDDGTPADFTPFGVDQFESVYRTGTISGSKDTNVVNGVGTSWMGNVLPGDRLVAGDNVLTVKRVEGDGQLRLVNYISEDVPASTPYEISRNLSVGFQFYPNQVTSYMTIPYYYYDRVFDMVNLDKDKTNLPEEFDDAILTRAEFKIKKEKGLSDWIGIAQLFSSELDGLKRDFRIAKPRYDIFAPETRGYPGRI